MVDVLPTTERRHLQPLQDVVQKKTDMTDTILVQDDLSPAENAATTSLEAINSTPALKIQAAAVAM